VGATPAGLGRCPARVATSPARPLVGPAPAPGPTMTGCPEPGQRP
jgi:hypothetical protein